MPDEDTPDEGGLEPAKKYEKITSWEQLHEYACSHDPEKRRMAVECITTQRRLFPKDISQDDVVAVVCTTLSRKERRKLGLYGSKVGA